jgi:hypothetical protein
MNHRSKAMTTQVQDPEAGPGVERLPTWTPFIVEKPSSSVPRSAPTATPILLFPSSALRLT